LARAWKERCSQVTNNHELIHALETILKDADSFHAHIVPEEDLRDARTVTASREALKTGTGTDQATTSWEALTDPAWRCAVEIDNALTEE